MSFCNVYVVFGNVWNPEWLSFLKEVTNCHFRQYPEWALAKKASGYDSRFFFNAPHEIQYGVQ